MTAIPTTFGDGGANLTSAGANGEPTLAETLRDVADDLAAHQLALGGNWTGLTISAASPTAVSAGALADFVSPAAPTAGEMGNVRTLVNQLRVTAQENRTLLLELKTDLNAIVPGAITAANPPAVTGGALAAFTDPPSGVEMTTLQALVNEIRLTEIANRLLAIDVKDKVTAAFDPAADLLTTKA